MNPASRVSIKVTLPVLMSLLVLVSFTMLGYITYTRVESAVGTLAVQNLTQVHERIGERLRDFFEVPERMNRINVQIISQGMLDRSKVRAWRPAFYEQLRAFGSVSSILWGDEAGHAIFVSRYPGRTEYVFGIVDADTARSVNEYNLAPDGTMEPQPWIVYPYDPRVRPWYRAAVEAGHSVWSDVYTWVAKKGIDPVLSIAYVTPVFGADRNLQGVMDVEFNLYDIGQFLKRLSIGKSGLAYIIDNNGLLVASSTDAAVLNNWTMERVTATASGNVLIATSAAELADLDAARQSSMTNFHGMLSLGGREMLLMASPFVKPGNLQWRVITVVPEDDFLGEIQEAKHQNAIGAGVAFAVALTLGLAVAMALARPIVRLAEHARRIGTGDLEGEIRLGGAREFLRLSAAINQMTEGLRDRMKLRQSLAMAMEVQQSLLPASTPDIPGLEIAGHSLYCDETGGDYYDYLDVSSAGPDAAVIAIGDVSGHGIAAAMVMASARGILRSRSRDAGSLAALLAHMNEQIAEDSSAGRFMTMLLVMVDRARRVLRWTSAGHQEPFLYDETAGQWIELHGGDPPLGVIPHAEYREHEFHGLYPGHVLLVATDGLWEAPNAEGESFGLHRVKGAVGEHAVLGAQGIRDGIIRRIQAFRGLAVQEDDITFVVVKVTPVAGQETINA
ncbi:MAG: SpoIIE family protein phosphatase [Gammaproteobacteria bacterium]|nr:SpoIIE family protein phosphatase [Gammaproteobacteria bacterium]